MRRDGVVDRPTTTTIRPEIRLSSVGHDGSDFIISSYHIINRLAPVEPVFRMWMAKVNLTKSS